MARPRYTYGECLEVAKNYTRLSKFTEDHNSLYLICLKNGWLDDLVYDARLIRRVKSDLYDYPKVLKIAKNYKTRREWIEGNPSSYRWAIKNKFLSQIFLEAEYIERPRYTLEDCIIEANKYDSEGHWKENGKCYKFARKQGWLEEIFKRVGYVKHKKRPWWYNL